MTVLSMIVAHANNRVIGKDNDMPWHMPADLKYFKQTTLKKPVIMGRKTYESIGFALPGRRNIVISRDANYQADGIETVVNIDDALALVSGVEEIMVIGGGSIYQHCLAKADRLYITEIDLDTDGDTFFPDYNANNEFHCISSVTHAPDNENPHPYSFKVYERQPAK
ncbi:type 3 dihydrofolate reductase [Thalassotalea ponticola]|uniref:type 3 dihydrofolate reductase n=1 Tax=Thalassotalea ponticola TaxID=1523392 RepID=UPI0025B5FF59|nr:type 3 dihydrofolate reductase [Thalassotalea ponticola]MDN3653375.1 type 3 dihydrofolate reductase [Thalassotalea ponticola]